MHLASLGAAYDAVYAYAHALQNWNVANPGLNHRAAENKETFKDYVFNVTFDSAQGAFAFDEKGDRDASLTVGNFNYEIGGERAKRASFDGDFERLSPEMSDGCFIHFETNALHSVDSAQSVTGTPRACRGRMSRVTLV